LYLKDEVISRLQAAFPTFSVVWDVGATLYASVDYVFKAATLAEFSQNLIAITQKLGANQISPAYPGLRIAVNDKQFIVSDNMTAYNKIPLALQDFIGQPTWIRGNEITFKTVMRGDIGLFDEVVFPTGVIAPYVLTTPAAAFPGSPARSNSVFQGKFFITEAHHWGNFRQADADSWVTVFTAVSTGYFPNA
jgi:hypothetical protein